MDGDATVRITAVEHAVPRPGFDGLFHRVTFEIASGDITPFVVPIWVHEAFPDTEIERTARLFLAISLQDAADAASQSDAEIAETSEDQAAELHLTSAMRTAR
jgi:hypothetical protein